MKIIKIVYEDDNRNKVVKGELIKEEEFTYSIKPLKSDKNIIIGKRAIVSIQEVYQ